MAFTNTTLKRVAENFWLYTTTDARTTVDDATYFAERTADDGDGTMLVNDVVVIYDATGLELWRVSDTAGAVIKRA